ncbi:Proteasome subunit alpha type-2 [Coemansia nantahalensis]|uniref:Proteasome subunit alpha type-2 n=2 Tax=Coemansia TaxID=4863 RepID=A0ACC1L673_9FUNG|nr:Proteasome subunit alpha type-2 [Coemansia nantahalensis]KAJ2773583.1 Proteasome subunit alpha type-2 [Coemansia nantahalensis]KAJ2801622.1 Proteasome subunit alpha type-2 [Coemansia helicoidea]
MDRYSFSLTTFAPNGKLLQIEHALAAVGNGSTSVGIKAANGVVIATEKKAGSSLIDVSSLEHMTKICDSIGMVYSGMGPDFRVLVSSARKMAQRYIQTYKEDPPVRILVKELASIMQEFTQSGGVRPFGVSLLLAGVDERGPNLYQVDPSGSYFPWKATAIGKNMVNSKTFLEKRFNGDMELEDAVHTAILTLKEGIEGQLTETSIDIGVISTVSAAQAAGEKPAFKRLTTAEIKDYLSNIA